MPRIIPQELNTKLRREYRMRFLSLLFFVLASIIFASVIFVSSSYLLLSMYENIYTTQDSDGKGEEITKTKEEYTKKVFEVHVLSQKVPSKEHTIDTNISNKIFEHATYGVVINSIEILPQNEFFSITIRGTSATREALLEFQNKIQNDGSFSEFSIPIEFLTKQKDISFNVNFIYDEK